MSGVYLATHRCPRVTNGLGILGCLVFIQSTFLLSIAEHRPFDGNLINWSEYEAVSYIEGSVWVAAILLLILLQKRRKLLQNSVFVIWAWSFLVLVYGVVVALPNLAPPAEPYFGDFYRLSKRSNVVHLVLDHTQGTLVHEILTSDEPQLAESLEGFTLYANSSGMYSSTYPSVPFLMTGKVPEIEDRVLPRLPFSHEYVRQTLDEFSIVRTLGQAGWSTYGFQLTPLYCGGGYAACRSGQVFDGKEVRTTELGQALRDGLALVDVALFRATPIMIRRWIYNREQWRLRNLFAENRSVSGIIDLFTRELTSDERIGSYNYFHHAGGHPPIQFDSDCRFTGSQDWTVDSTKGQVICTFRQLVRLLDRLQDLGLYDQTMIIVVGDHGSQWKSALMTFTEGGLAPRIISSANPLVLVKPPNTREPFRVSRAPVTIGDIADSITDAFELDRVPTGRSVFKIEEDSTRERLYLWSKPDPAIFQQEEILDVTPYRIRGNVLSEEAWIAPRVKDVRFVN